MMKFNEDFKDIYQKYQRFSAGIAFKIVKDKAAADDISQEVFYHLYKLGEKLDLADEERVRSLIATATVNKAKDYFRKAHVKRELYVMNDDAGKEIEDRKYNPEARMLRIEEKEYRKLVLERLYDKNPMNYDILMKVKYYGIPPDTVAAEYGITRNNVNNRIYKTKIWIAEEMSKLYSK